MIDQLIELDKKIFLYLNSLNTTWLDPIMLYASQTSVWVPLYLFLLFIVIKHFRNESWAPLLGIFITILLADQITSSLMKPFFQRLRPSQDPALQHLVHIVNGYKGGKFGFASSHSANTFGASIYFWLLLGKDKKWILFLFMWALFVSYSRIYLGVHYPGDTLAGILVGVLCAFIGFRIYLWLNRIYPQKKNNSTLSGEVH